MLISIGHEIIEAPKNDEELAELIRLGPRIGIWQSEYTGIRAHRHPDGQCFMLFNNGENINTYTTNFVDEEIVIKVFISFRNNDDLWLGMAQWIPSMRNFWG